ncbi:AAA family ATPase [Phytoactinopolyspora alkaliphila]|uniref:AAA family ATPase n=1 Tax=Phytoactinopolyspora alkaliphila TaxID=1783498 RepID=UPI001C205B05|nr:hypothetical protein [Phytoactinopolyspora alkaliphila]
MGATDRIQLLTAVSDADEDARLIGALESSPGRFVVARRCVDVADLLAAVGAGLGQAVLVTASLRRLDRDAVSRLHNAPVAVIGVVPSGDSAGERERLAALGIRTVVSLVAPPSELADAVTTAIAEAGGGPGPDALPVFGTADRDRIKDMMRAGGSLRLDDDQADTLRFIERGGQNGRLVAVWGPCGAPGRTTLAVNIAMEASLAGESTILADADTYGASVAQSLGLLDEAPGLAGVARVANNGQLDPISLARYARRITANLHVLTGIGRPARWTELRPSALSAVWEQTRSVAATTVVDCGFGVEEDELLSYDTEAPQRNGATRATLRSADLVVAVGSADPVGLGRLVRGLDDLTDVYGDASPPGIKVVVNRVRRSVAGPDPQRQITEALLRYASVEPFGFVPDDPAALDAALLQGQALAEIAPRSAARRAVAELTRRLLGAEAETDTGAKAVRSAAAPRGIARLRH